MMGITREVREEHLEKARWHVYDAYNDLVQAGMAGELTPCLKALRWLEDVLWQYTTPERTRANARGLY